MLRFLFSGKGRTSRKHYWLGYVLPVMTPLIIARDALPGMLAEVLTNSPHPIRDLLLLTIALSILVAWVDVAVSSRRFHDMGHSGWWAAAFPLVSAAAVIVIRAMVSASALPPETLDGLSLISATLLILVRFWVLGVQRGQKGPNHYGPDPLDPTGTGDVAEVFR